MGVQFTKCEIYGSTVVLVQISQNSYKCSILARVIFSRREYRGRVHVVEIQLVDIKWRYMASYNSRLTRRISWTNS